MKLCDFIRPASIQNARATLRDLGDAGLPIAGGTALHFLQPAKPVTAVDLTGLGLSGIVEFEDGYRIGATTPLADVMNYRAPRWALHEVCRRIATHQIRNQSTIGGNIARVFPWADLPAALLAMDATMFVQSEQEATMPADQYFESQPARLFETGDILTSIKIPALKAHMGFGYKKEVRTKSGFSLMTGATVMTLDGNTISDVRIAAGGAVFPSRLPEVEKALMGQAADEDVIREAVVSGIEGVQWKGREGMSVDYARHLPEVVLCDVLMHAKRCAQGRSE